MNFMQAQSQTLFERIGGQAALNTAVDIFYRKLLRDSRISPFFRNIDMNMQHAKQRAFLAHVLGGFPNYRGQSLRKAHERLVEDQGLNEEHFNIVATYLQETLRELKLSDDLIEEVMTIVGSTKNDVLNL